MSQWRLVMKCMEKLDGDVTAADVDRAGGSLFATMNAVYAWLREASRLGLLETELVHYSKRVTSRRQSRGRGGMIHVYRMTELGRRFLEGRVAQVPAARRIGRPRTFHATWLDALPRGLRIGVPDGWEP